MKKVFSRKELIHNALELIRGNIKRQSKVYHNVEFGCARDFCMALSYDLWMIGIISEDKRNLLSTIVSFEFAKIYKENGYR